MPPGLPEQLSKLAPVVGEFETEAAKIAADAMLSAQGKAARLQAARDVATAKVAEWERTLTAGVDRQAASLDEQLSKADAATPAPRPELVAALADRLTTFDPLEVEQLYLSASESERIAIEAACDRGRVPRRDARGNLVWQDLIDPARIEAVKAARRERRHPDVARARADAERIRNSYRAMASAARSLLK